MQVHHRLLNNGMGNNHSDSSQVPQNDSGKKLIREEHAWIHSWGGAGRIWADLDDGGLPGDGPKVIVEHPQADDVQPQVQEFLLHVNLKRLHRKSH